MKKDSYADTSENRDHMLTLSTQSQEDEHLNQRNSFNNPLLCDNTNKNLIQKNQLQEEDYDFTTESTTNCKNIDNKRGFKSAQCNKQKLSLVLNEISRAAATRSKTSIINAEEISKKNMIQKKWVNENQEEFNHDSQSFEDQDDPDGQYRLRKASIVSIYCKKNDITFVSSPQEFALKVMNNKSNIDEETPHLSQLQIELIISNKDCEEDSHSSMLNQQQQSSSNSQNQIPPLKLQTQTDSQIENRWYQQPLSGILQKYHATSEIEIASEEKEYQLIEDDDYNVLISSPHSNSEYQKAIQIHNSLLKDFQNECKQIEKSSSGLQEKMSAFDLLISLEQNIKNY